MEIELKYGTSPEVGMKLLEDVAGRYGTDIEEIPMEAVYYDTSDGALREKRLTYRIRKEGGNYMLTIKYGKGSDKEKKGLHRREEINIPVSEDFRKKPGIDVLDDTPVYREFDKAVGGQYSDSLGIMLPLKPLIPKIIMEFTRYEVRIPISDDKKTTAALSYDEGIIRAGDGETGISEVEIELLEGSEEDLIRFGADLSQKYVLTPMNKSKYSRGLKLLGEK